MKILKTSTKVTASTNPTILRSNNGYIQIDMWNGDKFVPNMYGADAAFSGADGFYRGNIYNFDGGLVGDYVATDSTLVEENFLIDFGD